MKKIVAKALTLVLSLALLLTALLGCASNGKAFMRIDDTEMSVNLYKLFLSRMKGTLSSAYYFGESALKDDFWDTYMSASGKTYNDHYTSEVLENVKEYLAALHMFDELGLELPKSYIDEIDEELQILIDQDANGSKNEFNAILSDFGVNYKMLREAYIMEAKLSYLNDYLFGTDGSKISPVLLEDYYQANYVRFKHVFIYTYALVYETDDNGDDIYFDATNNKKISYDKTATLKTDENGNAVKDKNGDKIYVTAEGKIAYDKINGKRSPVFDANGNQQTRKYTEKELLAASDYAQQVMEKCETDNYTLFDKLVENYTEDEGMLEYTNGYYLTAESDYDAPEVRDALFEMKAGEIKRINSEYGIHIVMKYELDEGGFSKEINSDFFIDTKSGGYKFMEALKSYLLSEQLRPYKEKIEIDEGLIEEVDIKSVGANYYY